MAELKRNQVNQILFTMVDKTDFATIESGLSADDIKCRVWGVNHGGSTATSALSLAAGKVSLVNSGIFRATLPAITRDEIIVRLSSTSTVSAAIQLLRYELVDMDTSDLLSLLSDFQSDFQSRVPKEVANASQLLLVKSMASDVYSLVSDFYSDFQSRVTGTVATASDVASKVWAEKYTAASNVKASTFGSLARINMSRISDVYSMLSDAYSDLGSKLTVIQSIASDAHSAAILAASYASDAHSAALLAASAASDAYSLLTSTSLYSDIASAVWGHAVGNSVAGRVSKIVSIASDAHSAAILAASLASDTHSLVAQVNSRVLLTQSFASDAHSAAVKAYSQVILTASEISDIHSQTTLIVSDTSNIYSLLGSASLYSDIASAVWGQKWDIHSTASTFGSAFEVMYDNLSVLRSDTSDIYSLLSDVNSNFGSRIPKLVLTNSTFSDALSKTQSSIESHVSDIGAGAITGSDISDIASLVWSYHPASQTGAGTASSRLTATASRALVNRSLISDVYSLVSDVQSAVAVAATASDVASKVWTTGYSNAWGNSTFGSLLFKTALSGFKATASDMSDLRSAITAGPQATVTASDISDIASAVWAAKYTLAHGVSSFGSAFRVNKSTLSDTYSLLSDFVSDFGSKVTKEVANASQLLLVKSMASDAHSAAVKSYSQVILAASELSDVHSQTTKILSDTSDIYSILGSASLYSDIASAVWAQHWNKHSLVSSFGSMFEVMASRISDIDSTLTSQYSDMHSLISTTMGASDMYSKVIRLASRITKPVALASNLLLSQSVISDVYSMLSDFYSDFTSKVPKAPATASVLSDFYSDFGSRVPKLVATNSYLSDALSKTQSSIESHVSGVTATISASDISNIASRVWAADYSVLGAEASSFGSMMNKFKSRITAVLATSDQLSKAQSSIESHVSGITASISTSDMSTIASRVWASTSDISDLASRVATQVWNAKYTGHSAASSFGSLLSDIHSVAQAGGLDASSISDIASAVWGQKFKGAAAHNVASTFGSAFALMSSRVSDIDSAVDSQYLVQASTLSDIQSQLTVIQSIASDAHSAAAQGSSRALVVQSIASDAHSAAILAASHASDAYSVALLCRSMISDVESAIDAGVPLDASALSDIASAVDARLDVAFTDAASLNANSLKERIRALGWIIRNKQKIDDATGNTTLYKDDNATTAFTVAGQFIDDGTSTLKKRYE